MKPEEKETLEELSKMKGRFHSLQPHQIHKGKFRVESLYVDGYGDLLFTVRSLLNLCTHILERGDLNELDSDKSPIGDIEEALKLAAAMMPIDEGDLLDSLRALLEKKLHSGNQSDPSKDDGIDRVTEPTVGWDLLRKV